MLLVISAVDVQVLVLVQGIVSCETDAKPFLYTLHCSTIPVEEMKNNFTVKIKHVCFGHQLGVKRRCYYYDEVPVK